jgi:N-acetylglucosaminyl-diphospho-decaprenol L-rhamnosyltransferase
MVSYYTGDILFRAITSVLAQTTMVELRLVDNGNPPDVIAKLEAIALIDSRFHLITGHGNVGFSKACNRGARDSIGRIFCS